LVQKNIFHEAAPMSPWELATTENMIFDLSTTKKRFLEASKNVFLGVGAVPVPTSRNKKTNFRGGVALENLGAGHGVTRPTNPFSENKKIEKTKTTK
jgi:hypothetical protein